MPIYAYRCDSCGVRKDVLQKLSEAPLTQCPDCGAPSFTKELSAPAFQLKGSGWYVTDFRDQGKKDKAPVEDKAAAGAESAPASPAAESGGKAGSSDAASAAAPSAASSTASRSAAGSPSTPAA